MESEEGKKSMLDPVTMFYWIRSWVELTLGSSFKWCFAAILVALEMQQQQQAPTEHMTPFWIIVQWLLGPSDRGIVQIVGFFYVSSLILGTLASLMKNPYGKREFQWPKIFLGLSKGALYLILLSGAWLLQTPPGQSALPVVGLVTAKGLEGFILLTEFVRFLKNADKMLERMGVGNILGLREIRYYVEANIKKRLKDISVAKRLNVLHVEDTWEDRKLVKALIDERVNKDELDINLVPVVSLKHAFDTLDNSDAPFNVAVVDLNLPDSKGFSTWQKFHTRYPQLPLVAITGEFGNDLQPLLEQGALMLCKKGLSSARLIEMLGLADNRAKIRELVVIPRLDGTTTQEVELDKILPKEI